MIVLSLCIFGPLQIPLQFIEHLFDLFITDKVVCHMATQYCRIVGAGLFAFVVSINFTHFATGQGKPRYSLYGTVAGSLVHFVLAPYLSMTLDLKLVGIAISSAVQFVVRGLVVMTCCYCDKDLQRSFVPLRDPRVWTKAGFSELNSLGWASFVLKVMGWWAFDVFTLLAANLAPA